MVHSFNAERQARKQHLPVSARGTISGWEVTTHPGEKAERYYMVKI